MWRNRQFRKLMLWGGLASIVAFGIFCFLTPWYDHEWNRMRRCRKMIVSVVEAARHSIRDGEMLPFTSDGRLNLFELIPEVCLEEDFAENCFFNESLSMNKLVNHDKYTPLGICDFEGVRFGKEKTGKVLVWQTGDGYGFKLMDTDHVREWLKNLKKPQIDAE